MKIGIIGERNNYVSYSMLLGTLNIDSIEIVWFVDAEVNKKVREKLYGESLYLGPFKNLFDRIANILRKIKSDDCRKLCQKNSIPYLKPRNYSINNGLPQAMYENPQADFVLIAGCDQILNESGLRLASKKVVNYHYSPLPAYRGKFVLFWQWYNRESYYGYSFHEVDLGIDTGDVIFQGAVPRIDGESWQGASKRVVLESANGLQHLYCCLINDTVDCLKEELVSSYYPSEKFQELVIIDKSKYIYEIKERIEKIGWCKLTNGLVVSKIVKAVEGDYSEYSIDNKGIYVPVKDGIILVRPFPSIPFALIRLLCGDNRLLSRLA